MPPRHHDLTIATHRFASMSPFNWLVRVSFTALIGFALAGPVTAVWAGEPQFARILKGKDAQELTLWGRRYENGEGVTKDVDRAIQLYCKAAQRGDVAAHYHLGWIYAVGRAGARDDDLAAAWFYRAAQKKDPQAQRMLARLGYSGKPKREATCVLSGGAPAQAQAQAQPGRRVAITRNNPAKGPIAVMVRQLAPQYRLNPNLVLAVIEQESGFNPQAMSPKNAQGLMQLIPATAQRFGVTDVWDPEQNLRGGMAYLKWLMNYFENDLELVLAAYNAGEGAVTRHGGIPPYAETQDYVKRIVARLN